MTYTIWQDRTDAKSAAERGICRELFRNLLDAGYAVGVHEGYDWAQKPTRNRDKLLASLASTDSDTVRAFTFDPETKKITGEAGHVWIVWGNDPEELIADYTTDLEETIAPALAKAEAAASRNF